MRTIEVSSTSVEKAIEKGLMLLETEREKVEVKVIEENSTLKKFKIEMTLFESDEEKEEFNKNNKQPAKVEIKEKRELPYDAELSKEVLGAVEDFLHGFLKAYGSEYTLQVVEEDKDINAYINGENMGGLIGHHGDALESLQLILNTYIREKFANYERRVNLDIENYRAKRENTIVDLALRLASKVVKNKSSMKLEPMSRYERKIIHNALQGKDHIATHSEGVDPNRYLVIDYIA